MQVILFSITSSLIIITSIIVITVFIVTGRATLTTGRDFKLTESEKQQLSEYENKLSQERQKLSEMSPKANGKCQDKFASLLQAVSKDNASAISASFIDFYACSHQHKLSLSFVQTVTIQLKAYGLALNKYAELKEELLQDNPELSEKEILSLTCRRLKSTVIPFDIDLVNATIATRQAIQKFINSQASSGEAQKLLYELDTNPTSPSNLAQLINLFKMKVKCLQEYLVPIIKAQDSACKAKIYADRRWKLIQKFKFSASHSAGNFKQSHPEIYQKIMKSTNEMFQIQHALGRIEFLIAVQTAIPKFPADNPIRTKLTELLESPDVAKLILLHEAAQNDPLYEDSILPIIQAYEKQSRNRLLVLGSIYDLNFLRAFMEDSTLTEDLYRKSKGAIDWNAFLAHKFNDYQRIKDELLPDG